MNKSELIGKVSAEAGVEPNQAEAVIAALFNAVVEATKNGDKVAWAGFGAFSVSDRAARSGRNPQTGATIEIAASRVMRFSPAAALKGALNS